MARYSLLVVLGWSVLWLIGQGCSGPGLSRDEEAALLMAKNRRLEDDLRKCEVRLAELAAAGAQPAAGTSGRPEDPFKVVAVRFGKFTGVLESSRITGADRLKVVIEPLDAAGDVVKRAGSLDLEVLEPGAAGEPPRPFHRWAMPLSEFQKTWLNGVGTYGYVMRLAWPRGRVPSGIKVILRATFTTLDGQAFSAETEVTLASAARPAKPPAAAGKSK